MKREVLYLSQADVKATGLTMARIIEAVEKKIGTRLPL